MCDKKTYIERYKIGCRKFKYTAYIPYHMDNDEHENCYYNNTFGICTYFGLPTTRKNGEPTYTNRYGDNIYEIGIICKSLKQTYDKIKMIQTAIVNKGGIINDKIIFKNWD